MAPTKVPRVNISDGGKKCRYHMTLVERSMVADRFVFFRNAEMTDGWTTPTERISYQRFWNKMMQTFPCLTPDAFVYLDVDSGVCSNRQTQRGRAEEKTIPMDYMKAIDKLHRDIFIDGSVLRTKYPDGVEVRILTDKLTPFIKGRPVLVVPQGVDAKKNMETYLDCLDRLLPSKLTDVWISVEGNIAAGKSTTLSLQKNKTIGGRAVRIIDEPLGDWGKCDDDVGPDVGINLLEEFYNDPKANAYSFQHTAFVSRMLQWIGEAKKFGAPKNRGIPCENKSSVFPTKIPSGPRTTIDMPDMVYGGSDVDSAESDSSEGEEKPDFFSDDYCTEHTPSTKGNTGNNKRRRKGKPTKKVNVQIPKGVCFDDDGMVDNQEKDRGVSKDETEDQEDYDLVTITAKDLEEISSSAPKPLSPPLVITTHETTTTHDQTIAEKLKNIQDRDSTTTDGVPPSSVVVPDGIGLGTKRQRVDGMDSDAIPMHGNGRVGVPDA
jgi:deoxyadenosine/deoxycytidine kinase